MSKVHLWGFFTWKKIIKGNHPLKPPKTGITPMKPMADFRLTTEVLCMARHLGNAMPQDVVVASGLEECKKGLRHILGGEVCQIKEPKSFGKCSLKW